jgi:hypothetical protein
MNLRFKILIGLILILSVLIGFDQSRTFYCLSENQCVTVWKRLGNKCYIIPGKYYWIASPSDNYIETSNTQYLTLYFSDKLPKKIVVRNQGNSSGKDGYKIKSHANEDWELLEYSERYRLILYHTLARKFNDVQFTTNYMNLYIEESYCTDKSGRKLK